MILYDVEELLGKKVTDSIEGFELFEAYDWQRILFDACDCGVIHHGFPVHPNFLELALLLVKVEDQVLVTQVNCPQRAFPLPHKISNINLINIGCSMQKCLFLCMIGIVKQGVNWICSPFSNYAVACRFLLIWSLTRPRVFSALRSTFLSALLSNSAL